MNTEEIQRRVFEILELVLKRRLDHSTDTLRKNTDAWDSLKHIEIMFAIEDEFQIEFAEDDFVRLDSFNKIVDAVKANSAA